MKPLPRLTPAAQSAAHLRERLGSGQWAGKLPGVVRLGAELQVSQTTARAALRQLEAEDLIRNPPRLVPFPRRPKQAGEPVKALARLTASADGWKVPNMVSSRCHEEIIPQDPVRLS